MQCEWCGNVFYLEEGSIDFCSNACAKAAGKEYELYLDWYNDYMSGYDVPSFEKITKRKRREEA